MENSDKKQLDRIEKMVLDIINHFHIGSNVVHLSDIKEQARKDVALARQREGKDGR